MCNYGGREVTNLDVLGTGIVFNGVITTTIVNHGRVSNFHITTTGKLSGGVVTGYIVNEGVMRDFEFVGMSIIGGTLGGVIPNNSRVGGYFQDVTLLPNTQITGGIRSGIITGDKDQPALLENVRMKGRSKLSGGKVREGGEVREGSTPGGEAVTPHRHSLQSSMEWHSHMDCRLSPAATSISPQFIKIDPLFSPTNLLGNGGKPPKRNF